VVPWFSDGLINRRWISIAPCARSRTSGWLRARRGIGVGWVSIIRRQDLCTALGIPEAIEPVAYLCLGYVSEFLATPELEQLGWRQRLPLRNLVWFDRWSRREGDESLMQHLE
jgi:5,6-dimethylbenzimidazole synthase